MNTVRAAHALAILFAFVLARRVPSSRQSTIAWTLAALLAIDLALPPLAAWPEAYAAIWCAFYALTAWAVVVILRQESPGPTKSEALDRRGGFMVARSILLDRGRMASASLQGALVLAGLFVASTLAFRAGRPASLERGAVALSLAFQLFAGLRATIFGTWPRREDLAAWLTAWVLICSSSVDALAGAWAVAQPVRDWYLTHWISGATWLLIIWGHTWTLLRKPTES